MTHSWDSLACTRHAPFVSDLGLPLLDLPAARPGERVLDLGCGDGALTAKLLESGRDVVRIDGDVAMVTAARNRGLTAHVMDAQALPFESEFDAGFGTAAFHRMKRANAMRGKSCQGKEEITRVGGIHRISMTYTAWRLGDCQELSASRAARGGSTLGNAASAPSTGWTTL